MDNQELNQHYQRICAQIGDARFKIKQLEDYISTSLKSLDQLNKAYLDSQAQAKQESLKQDASKQEDSSCKAKSEEVSNG